MGVDIPPGVGEMAAKNPPNHHIHYGSTQPRAYIPAMTGPIDFKFGIDIGVDNAIQQTEYGHVTPWGGEVGGNSRPKI